MAQITIRRLDDEIVRRLRVRAAQAGHSMEEEARRVLGRSLGVDKQALIEKIEKLRAENGPHAGPTSAQVIREIRDRVPDWLAKSEKPQNVRRRR